MDNMSTTSFNNTDIYLDGATQEGSRNVMRNMSSTSFHNISAYAPVGTVDPPICQMEILLIPHVLGIIE